jgi:hypothetical protein
MKIPDELRKCTAFLAYSDGKEYILIGTVFWVGVRTSDLMGVSLYAVTARHLIEKVEAKAADWSPYLRVNFVGSGVQWIKTSIDDWRFHPNDQNVDVAVLPVDLPFGRELDHRFFETKSFVTEETIKLNGIGVGDDVFLTGLFGRHIGKSKNIPIIRIGNIAAMPEEPIQTLKWAHEMEAYLIESRSIGGLSGSPVFVHMGDVRETRFVHSRLLGSFIYLLGLMHGHWDIPVVETDDRVLMDADFADSVERVNMGIAILVPAQKILEVIDQPELKKMREDYEA